MGRKVSIVTLHGKSHVYSPETHVATVSSAINTDQQGKQEIAIVAIGFTNYMHSKLWILPAASNAVC